jgi:hypothetical protein
MRVHANARVHLDYLCETLGSAEPLDLNASLLALAAFLRVRLREGPKPLDLRSGKRTLGLTDFTDITAKFISADPEGGKRGQAFVAAALSLVFEQVKTNRVNDPGRHWPGDILVLKDRAASLTAEVKQRRTTDTEIAQFVARARDAGIRRAVVAALDPWQSTLPVDELRADAWYEAGVHLSIFEDIASVLSAALTWTPLDLSEALSTFPALIAERLEELEVSPEGQLEWAQYFATGQE